MITVRNAILIAGAFVLPPLPVFLIFGFSMQLLLGVVLSLMGHVPGVLYALWVIWLDNSERNGQTDIESAPSTSFFEEEPALPPIAAEDSQDASEHSNHHDLSKPIQSSSNNEEGSLENGAPPAYDNVVGDFKIQH